MPVELAARERHCRALVTRYLAWIERHTLPVLAVAPNHEILRIDLEALTDLCSSVVMVMLKQGRTDECATFIDAVSRRTPLPRFEQRAAYFRAECSCYGRDDEAGALKHLEQLAPLDQCDYSPAIELYVSLAGDTLDPGHAMRLYDAIIALTHSSAIRLHYETAKAMANAVLGGTRTLEALNRALAAFEKERNVETLTDPYDCTIAARAYSLRGRLAESGEDTERATMLYERIKLEELTDEGKLAHHTEVGRHFLDSESPRRAIESLSAAIPFGDAIVARIYLCDAYVQLEDLARADAVARELLLMRVPDELTLELLMVVGRLFCAMRDRERLRAVVEMLRKLHLRLPYFALQRERACVELLAAADELVSTRRIVDRFRWISRFLELKPNFFGLGVNVNAIIDGARVRKD